MLNIKYLSWEFAVAGVVTVAVVVPVAGADVATAGPIHQKDSSLQQPPPFPSSLSRLPVPFAPDSPPPPPPPFRNEQALAARKWD